MSLHWLDSKLERKSKTLACRRFSGTHSYDRIALLLEAIHAEFGLDSQKVLATVTDSGSNFVKAFKEFGVEMESYNSEPEESSTVEEDFLTETDVEHSLYDGLKQIESIQDKSEHLFIALGLTDALRSNDFHYIKEYLQCSKPIAEALDIIQGEHYMYYGILLPCLVSLRKKLQ